jgi:hypothetical protein
MIVVAPLEPRDRPFGERADAVEFERIEGQPVLDQTVGGEAWVVLIVEQSEGTGHRCENTRIGRGYSAADLAISAGMTSLTAPFHPE